MNGDADFLFARPSFLEGISRLVDLAGTLNTYNSSSSEEEADARAMRSDWCAVGDYLRQAISQEAEHEQQRPAEA